MVGAGSRSAKVHCEINALKENLVENGPANIEDYFAALLN